MTHEEEKTVSEWPSCGNCRYVAGDGGCGYKKSRNEWKREPADVTQHGFCGFWHAADNGETIRARCRIVIAETQNTRPPVS